ncbi:DUF3570 domain-containing protein [Lacinutrix sp. WUR7]|uniref:DUF3570 domain-containing protein n=1 Tax=Lacinutrix sp. WUR7 TaxID=2653681 RepID=UPI00193D2606|nr:DUF3570 domain-containing protein [Lacinutrix sp. WUR7]QRM90394.1 DUF3570 domain-containing protein [Lacinutrix sp. WUR7]
MKNILTLVVLFAIGNTFAQQDSTAVYKKRVLETTEVDFLTSYYSQDGDNASVTGGIGSEELTDFTPTLIVSLPLSADEVLTIDAGISSYSSASSSNLDPFDGASEGSPWVASSGASQQDTWASLNVGYSHSSDDRNNIWSANVSFANEFDYTSIGFGGGFAKLFNEKNTEIGVKANVYLDTWKPVYPIELDAFKQTKGNLNQGFFQGIDILDQNGSVSTNWSPVTGFDLIKDKARNSYSLSFSFSQILSKKAQMALFFDLVKQDGWLANPMQRVYFGDVDNYYVGNAASIANYTSSSNKDVFQLADDIERLPDSRFKIPLGMRFNYYINETISLRTYYRYYFDDWGINSHTANVELPIKITSKFTLYPSYRFYNQTAADYFAPYEENVSTSEFYTSDYDLSKFSANQYGFGVSYTDIFTNFKIWKFGLKNVDFKYHNYKRNTGLSANIFAIGFKFVMD